MHDLDRTLRTYDSETDGEAVWGENEYALESQPISEEEEIDLAAELLTLSGEEELDQFLGKLLRKAGRFVKPLAKTLLPIAGKVVGTYFGGPAGGALGGKLASMATRLFEIDMETMGAEEVDLEVARRFVRLASAAAQNAAKASPGTDPRDVARSAVARAAKTHAPGLLRRAGSGTASASFSEAGGSGRWIRRNNRIVLLGVS